MKKPELEIDDLKKKIKLMRQLSSENGFFKYYFENLKNFETKTACFNHCNDLFFELFGSYKYTMAKFFKGNSKKRKILNKNVRATKKN